ncbi:MAG: response regulator [Xenococcaceae cyanobacterium]
MTTLPNLNNILLVEDTLSQQELMAIAIEDCQIPHRLHIVNNGEEALDFLLQKNLYSQAPRPNLIILDLNLPKLNGYELLTIIKQNSNLKIVPVIIFTTSKSSSDVKQSYTLGANCYISKPYDLEEFLTVVKTSLKFWLNFTILP